MYDFHSKIKMLESCEATVYAICLTLLIDEPNACHAAKAALVELFRDDAYWKADNDMERHSILRRHCVAGCMSRRRLAVSVS